MSTTTDPRQGWTSASGAPADFLCQGRHLAQRGLQSKSTEDAISGSRVHEALATGDVSKLDRTERETYDACKEIESKLIDRFFEGSVPVIFQHQRFWIEFHGNNPDGTDRTLKHSGEVDLCARLGERALVIDRKTLMGQYAASPGNLQLRDYAVLVRNEFVFIKEVAVAIVQPLVTHSPELCVYHEDDLITAERQLYLRVIASNDPRSKRTPGDIQCKFCLAKGQCLEYQRWATNLLPHDGASSDSLAMALLMNTPVAQWTDEQFLLFLNVIKPGIDRGLKWFDSVIETIKERLPNHPLKGWGLKPGNKREIINNPQKVYERFIALGGKHDAFMKAVLVKKGDLEDALNATTGARGQALDKAMDAICQGCVEVRRNAPSLERKDDER